jgi:hypothetical protein
MCWGWLQPRKRRKHAARRESPCTSVIGAGACAVNEHDIDSAFAALVQRRTGGLITQGLLVVHRPCQTTGGADAAPRNTCDLAGTSFRPDVAARLCFCSNNFGGDHAVGRELTTNVFARKTLPQGILEPKQPRAGVLCVLIPYVLIEAAGDSGTAAAPRCCRYRSCYRSPRR